MVMKIKFMKHDYVIKKSEENMKQDKGYSKYSYIQYIYYTVLLF